MLLLNFLVAINMTIFPLTVSTYVHKEVAALVIYVTVIRRRAIINSITRVRKKMHKMTAKWANRVTFPNSSIDFDDLFFQRLNLTNRNFFFFTEMSHRTKICTRYQIQNSLRSNIENFVAMR